MSEKKKILVTGASGFVGSVLLEELQSAGNYDIYCQNGNRRSSETDQKPAQNAKIFRGDISDSSSEIFQKTDGLEKADMLVHAAGLAHQFRRVSREDFWRVNVEGTENVCRLARRLGVEHFVLISSVAVYGDHGAAEIDETFACRPEGFYAESKLESEKKADEFCKENEIRLTILRLATVIGEGDRGNTMRLITSIDKGRFLWIGNGGNKKSLIYKSDVARGILKALEAKGNAGTEIYNLTAEAVSIREVVEAISESLDKKIPRLRIPFGLIRIFFGVNKTFSFRFLEKYEKTIRKWLSDDIFSGRKFSEKFNFEPATPVREAIAREVEHYLSRKKG